ncbi:hypothetical protein Pan153_02150 [Gimesia panareensis]|uniref:Uncharacterized protein n=1 Tax=Gimesia panareensis TaxID=2527978 RepID=A0A518FGY3_9PLAN|nr:hypothetical protein Pan153_02150 [Gimesia panareensis]
MGPGLSNHRILLHSQDLHDCHFSSCGLMFQIGTIVYCPSRGTLLSEREICQEEPATWQTGQSAVRLILAGIEKTVPFMIQFTLVNVIVNISRSSVWSLVV